MNTPLLNTQTARQLLAGLLFLFITLQMAGGQPSPWDGTIATKIENVNGGDGSKDKPILINTAAELAYFAKQVNGNKNITYYDGSGDKEIAPGGKSSYHKGFWGYYFALSNDINLNGVNWKPIGNQTRHFCGNFDGGGYVITNLAVKVEGPQAVYAGLFGYINNGSIQNLGVELHEKGIRAHSTGNQFNSRVYAGGIAGYFNGLFIRNCYVGGPGLVEVTGGFNIYTGGIVGTLQGNSSLSHCYTTVDVKATGGSNQIAAGGIAGDCSGKSLSYTYATGSIEAAGTYPRVGGICGFVNSISPISHNLALNKEIKGDDNNTHRIIGKLQSGTSSDNYASLEMYVNGKLGSGDNENDENGSGAIDLNNYENILSSNATNEENEGWHFDQVHLPKIKVVKGYSSNPSFEDNNSISFANQPDLLASDYLIAVKIENTGGGDGTSWDSPILIANRAELAYFAKQVNEDQSITYGSENKEILPDGTSEYRGFAGYYFALSSDIDLNGFNWTPIGNVNHSFRGCFDGDGHSIINLAVDVTSSQNVYAGLFGHMDNGGIQNLGVELHKEGIRAHHTGNNDLCAGGIAGYFNGNFIRNCYVAGPGSVEATGGYTGYIIDAGGIVGNFYGTLSHCYTTIDVKAGEAKYKYVGGIAGGYSGYHENPLSYTYATGSIEASGSDASAGGICGLPSGAISHNLALNKEIKGTAVYTHRIVSLSTTLSANYASPEMYVNGKTPPPADLTNTSLNGANTWLDSFENDLKAAPAGADNGWIQAWTFTDGYLPQLKKVKEKSDGSLSYDIWESTSSVNRQTLLPAADYLPNGTTLYIVQPNGGTLTVSDPSGNSLPDGYKISVGTLLTLSATPESDYELDAYLTGSSESALADHGGSTISMPSGNDLYLSTRFKKKKVQEPEEPPYVPVYYTVTLPAVEGAVTDPIAGSYEKEAWDTFRFYLTLDTAYSESVPVVTTSRNETIHPRTSDGAYLVTYIRNDVEIFIDGIVKNNPVANETIRPDAGVEPQIWAEGTRLCIRIPDDTPSVPVRILTFDGRLIYNFRSAPGLNARQLPIGLYIVKVGDTVRKVAVGR